MSFHTGMTAAEYLKEAKRQREAEAARLDAMAAFYKAEAAKLRERNRKDSAVLAGLAFGEKISAVQVQASKELSTLRDSIHHSSGKWRLSEGGHAS